MSSEKPTNKKIPLSDLVAAAAKRLGISEPKNATDSDVEGFAELLEPGVDGGQADTAMVERWLAGELPDANFIPCLCKLAGFDVTDVETPASAHPNDPPMLDELLLKQISTDGKVDEAKVSALANKIARQAGIHRLDQNGLVRWAHGNTIPAMYIPHLLKECKVTLAEANFARAKRMARQKLQTQHPGAVFTDRVEGCRNAQEWAALAETIYPNVLRGRDLPRIANRLFSVHINDRAAATAASKEMLKEGLAPGSEMIHGTILAIDAFLADPKRALAACAWSPDGELDPPGPALYDAFQALVKSDRQFSPEILEPILATEFSRPTLEDLLRPRRGIVPNPATLARALRKHPPLCVALLGKMPNGKEPDAKALAKMDAGRASGPVAALPAPTTPSKPDDASRGKKPPSKKNPGSVRPSSNSLLEAWRRLIATDRDAYGPSPALAERTGLSLAALTGLEQGITTITPTTAERLVKGIPQLWDNLPPDQKAQIPDPRLKKDAEPEPPPETPPLANVPTAVETETDPIPADALSSAPADVAPPLSETPAPTDAPVLDAAPPEPPSPPEASPVETPLPAAIPGERLVLAEAGPDAASDNGLTLPAPPPSMEIEDAKPAGTPDAAPPAHTLPVPAEPPQAPAVPKDEAPAEPQRLHPDDIEAIARHTAETLRQTAVQTSNAADDATTRRIHPDDMDRLLEAIAASAPRPEPAHDQGTTEILNVPDPGALHMQVAESLVQTKRLAAALLRNGVPLEKKGGPRWQIIQNIVALMKVLGLSAKEVELALNPPPLSAKDLQALSGEKGKR